VSLKLRLVVVLQRLLLRCWWITRGLLHVYVRRRRWHLLVLVNHLQFLDTLDNLDSVKSDRDAKVRFQISVCHMINNCSINAHLLKDAAVLGKFDLLAQPAAHFLRVPILVRRLLVIVSVALLEVESSHHFWLLDRCLFALHIVVFVLLYFNF